MQLDKQNDQLEHERVLMRQQGQNLPNDAAGSKLRLTSAPFLKRRHLRLVFLWAFTGAAIGVYSGSVRG